jgi:alkylation response protein AidB-like acyl-CoA dehydrogenase
MILNDEQKMIRDMAKSFAADKISPNALTWEKDGAYPEKIISEMGALGLLGMTVPENWGGGGTDYVSYALALMEIAGGDGGLSTLMSVNNSPVCSVVLNAGNQSQKETYLKPLAKGEMIGSFCLTEPQAGSDASMLKTKAEKHGNGYIINGSKQFITSAHIAKVAIIFAITDQDAGKKGMSAFLVPTDTKGLNVAKPEQKMGQKASDTCAVSFDDMEISSECLLGSEGEGYKIALANLETGRIGIGAQSVGMARAALNIAINYANERVSFGKAIIDHQAVGFRLADMATKLAAAEALVLKAANLKDHGQPCLVEASMAKLFASEAAEEICSASLQTLGGYGYLSEYGLEKIVRDVRVCQIYEGTSDIQKMVISRTLKAK